MQVERYGAGATGEVLLALCNPTAAPVRETQRLERATPGLPASGAQARLTAVRPVAADPAQATEPGAFDVTLQPWETGVLLVR